MRLETHPASSASAAIIPESTPGFFLQRIVQTDLCVGCGVCAAADPCRLRMTFNANGAYQPELVNGYQWHEVEDIAAAVCPSAEHDEDETTIGQREFGDIPDIHRSDLLGYYLRTDAAWVTNDEQRLASSAGGLGTWLTRFLLTNRLVDGVVCVMPSTSTTAHFEYRIVRRGDDLERSRKSKYYPIELSAVVRELAMLSGRYAIVALPCFAKAVRLAIRHGVLPRARVHCIIGLFCGHLKTRQFAQYLIRCCGFHERDVVAMDFRRKQPPSEASDYRFTATARQTDASLVTRSIRMRENPLGNWGLNAFMLKACECCDDVVAELADIAIGDAWLPEFARDGRGTNLVITRRADLVEVLAQGVAQGELHLMAVAPSAVAAAQDGAFRQRRAALAYRLHLAAKQGEWRPKKRVAPDRHALRLYAALIQRLRLRIAHATKENFRRFEGANDVSAFAQSVRPLIAAHDFLYVMRHALRRRFEPRTIRR